jgi:hypothetical protein
VFDVMVFKSVLRFSLAISYCPFLNTTKRTNKNILQIDNHIANLLSYDKINIVLLFVAEQLLF